jgi:uncharacterized protein (DUF433 family)
MTVDWSECEMVERVPGKVGGRPVVKGTRIPADTILTDEELGATVEETHESFPSLSVETIRSLRAYGQSHKPCCNLEGSAAAEKLIRLKGTGFSPSVITLK